MKNSKTIAVIIFGLLLTLATSVYAGSKIRLLLNGKELKTEVPPELVEGEVLVPLSVIGQAFGATVKWDEKTNSVFIDHKEQEDKERQVELLKEALAPKDPLTAAESWAEGVKTRNGAWQYAVLSPELKAEHYKRFQEANWSTGTSSPWIESYQVTEKYRVDTDVYRFAVEFTYTDSTKKTFSTKEYVTIRNYEGEWLVSSIEKVEVKGEITKLNPKGDKKGKSLFVQAKEEETVGYDQANVIIGSATKIYKGYTDQELTVDHLKKGMEVEVVFTDDPRIMIYPVSAEAKTIRVMESEDSEALVYENTRYGFVFSLTESWEGYRLVTEEWEGQAVDDEGKAKTVETGSLLKIRHPQWTAEEPRQDIPIIVFTLAQWEQMQKGEFHIGAAPMGPKELGRNSKYVFALPARYNYAFPTGYEEVEEILAKHPLKPVVKPLAD